MPEPLLVRDVMRIGVPTCKLEDTLQQIAALFIEQGYTSIVVLDEDGDTRGWINEQMLAAAYPRAEKLPDDAPGLSAADVMDENVPECPAEVPLEVALQIMADQHADHLYFLHRAGGRTWPASQVSYRDIVRALAGPDYVQGQGAAAPRLTPMDLFRQRNNLPPKK
jgi:CBS domain containing-hemolysin-like protein